MNRALVAALLRELADAIEAPDDSTVHGAAAPAPKRARRQREIVRPPGEAPPAVAEQAARILRNRGFR
jgi:hypothetical protein